MTEERRIEVRKAVLEWLEKRSNGAKVPIAVGEYLKEQFKDKEEEISYGEAYLEVIETFGVR